MHPVILEARVRQHREELRQVAEDTRRARPGRGRRPRVSFRRRVRRRIGWFLVERGLRLVTR